MSETSSEVRGFHEQTGFPWLHIVGFVISVALTLGALWLVRVHALPGEPLFLLILFLAVLQIGVQLFFFMHITESPGPRYHIFALLIGLLFTVTVIAGSIWIMTFDGSNPY